MEAVPAHGINTYKQKFNPHRLLRREHIWLWEHMCSEHGVSYIRHQQCFFRDLAAGKIDHSAPKEKIGFFDIEATGLKGDWDYILCYCIKVRAGKTISRAIRPSEIRNGAFDKRLCMDLCRDLRQFDRIVVYWGADRRYDFPMSRTRTLYHARRAKGKDRERLIFPAYMALHVEDLYDTVKAKMCMTNRKLVTVARTLDVPAKGHWLNPTVRNRAMAGDKPSLDWIVTHCEEDVETTAEVWEILHGFTRRAKRSI